MALSRLIDDGPLSSFQGRSSSASSFHASLLQAIDGVMCPQLNTLNTVYFRRVINFIVLYIVLYCIVTSSGYVGSLKTFRALNSAHSM